METNIFLTLFVVAIVVAIIGIIWFLFYAREAINGLQKDVYEKVSYFFIEKRLAHIDKRLAHLNNVEKKIDALLEHLNLEFVEEPAKTVLKKKEETK